MGRARAVAQRELGAEDGRAFLDKPFHFFAQEASDAKGSVRFDARGEEQPHGHADGATARGVPDEVPGAPRILADLRGAGQISAVAFEMQNASHTAAAR